MEQEQANGGRARERHKKRKQRQAMVARSGEKRTKQTRSQARSQSRVKLPKVRLPQNRLLVGIPVGILVIVSAIAILAFLKAQEPIAMNNAIWVDKSWTYADRTSEDLDDYINTLRYNQIGNVYAYVSSLNINNNWMGGLSGDGSFMQSRGNVTSFVANFKQKYPSAKIYGWIEIWTNLDTEDGYRLDDEALQENVADFSLRMIEEMGFDGVFLDVKPLFTGSEDLLRLLRAVRAQVGLDTPIIVSVPADLTPNDEMVAPIDAIAPGTIWDKNFKQRVLLSANEVVITVYQSYRDNPLDYINWVAYQVKTYVKLISELTTDTRIIISVPNYQTESTAHDPSIETIAGALDGINVGLGMLDEETQSLLSGVAIYSDRDLSDDQWQVYRQKWLRR
jgi:hypothetical protein